MGDLGEYRKKRDPHRTPEPVPADNALPTGDDDTFVIQEHHARRLHWDVRLERGGVLVSWAVPKGLPELPGDIRLAVHTEDHPMEYATFEGTIPKGEYGGGRMFIWDRGRYETLKWSDREVQVVFAGERIRGKYTFFRSGRAEKDWMVRRSDPPQQTDWQPLPELLEPMLAVAGVLPHDTDDESWAYEFKWDGVRALARVEGGRLRLHARKGNEITARYPELRQLGAELGSTQVWLDGEIVALVDGRPTFYALQSRIHAEGERSIRRAMAEVPITYLVFDVLHLNGQSCLELPYQQRRQLLEALELSGPNWHTSPSYPGEGAAVVEAAREQRLEGVIAKRLSSRYYPGRRTADWIKISEIRPLEVIVGGWRPGEGKRSDTLGSLMIGVPVEDGLRYVGQVGTGFSEEVLRSLIRTLKSLERKDSPFVNEVPRDRAKGAHWATPSLVGEVEFLNWTSDGRLRAPRWRGLRADKNPDDVAVMELPDAPVVAPDAEPADVEAPPDPPARTESRPESGDQTTSVVSVEGRRLQLSNLDKVLYPDAGFTKGEVINYYSRIAPVLLPHIKGRPLTMRRYPNGVAGQSFYEKNAARHAPDWVRTVTVDTPGSSTGAETLDFAVVDDLPTLVWVAQLASLELHVPQWTVGPRGGRHDPDRLVFDLDPGAPASIVECCRVALLLREELAAAGLEPVAKTSGSKGMQLYCAIESTSPEQPSSYAKALAERLAAAHPGLVVAKMAKNLRSGKVFIDWSQNNPYKTTVAPYSLRARERPTVSTPVTWDEVERCRRPEDLVFTADDVLDRFDEHGDLFAPLLTAKKPPKLTDSPVRSRKRR